MVSEEERQAHYEENREACREDYFKAKMITYAEEYYQQKRDNATKPFFYDIPKEDKNRRC